MAEAGSVTVEITTKTDNRAEQVGMYSPKARPGGRYFLSPDRPPPGEQRSRKHAHAQGRLCARFVAPVIGNLACEDVKTWDL